LAPAASGYHSHHPIKYYQSLIRSREISVKYAQEMVGMQD
jgi:hypothetical protein